MSYYRKDRDLFVIRGYIHFQLVNRVRYGLEVTSAVVKAVGIVKEYSK